MLEYKFTFTENELQIINAALSELPYRLAAPVINSMNKQLIDARKDSAPKE